MENIQLMTREELVRNYALPFHEMISTIKEKSLKALLYVLSFPDTHQPSVKPVEILSPVRLVKRPASSPEKCQFRACPTILEDVSMAEPNRVRSSKSVRAAKSCVDISITSRASNPPANCSLTRILQPTLASAAKAFNSNPASRIPNNRTLPLNVPIPVKRTTANTTATVHTGTLSRQFCAASRKLPGSNANTKAYRHAAGEPANTRTISNNDVKTYTPNAGTTARFSVNTGIIDSTGKSKTICSGRAITQPPKVMGISTHARSDRTGLANVKELTFSQRSSATGPPKANTGMTYNLHRSNNTGPITPITGKPSAHSGAASTSSINMNKPNLGMATKTHNDTGPMCKVDKPNVGIEKAGGSKTDNASIKPTRGIAANTYNDVARISSINGYKPLARVLSDARSVTALPPCTGENKTNTGMNTKSDTGIITTSTNKPTSGTATIPATKASKPNTVTKTHNTGDKLNALTGPDYRRNGTSGKIKGSPMRPTGPVKRYISHETGSTKRVSSVHDSPHHASKAHSVTYIRPRPNMGPVGAQTGVIPSTHIKPAMSITHENTSDLEIDTREVTFEINSSYIENWAHTSELEAMAVKQRNVDISRAFKEILPVNLNMLFRNDSTHH